MDRFYRVAFIGLGILPAMELVCLPFATEEGWEASLPWYLLLVLLALAGLVLVDIRSALLSHRDWQQKAAPRGPGLSSRPSLV